MSTRRARRARTLRLGLGLALAVLASWSNAGPSRTAQPNPPAQPNLPAWPNRVESPHPTQLKERLKPPLSTKPSSGRYWLGTDRYGRDLARLLATGGSISLTIACTAAGLTVLLGAAAASIGRRNTGWALRALEQVETTVLALPTLLLVFTLSSLFESIGTLRLILILGTTGWVHSARLLRTELRRLQSTGFVESAVALGASPSRVLLRHLAPHLIAPTTLCWAVAASEALLAESALSFLGLGLSPLTPSWGNLLQQASTDGVLIWWLATFPGALILAAALFFQHLATCADRGREHD